MTKRTCSIDGCDKPTFGHGWCNTHYSRWRRHGDVEYVGTRHTPKRNKRKGEPCSVEGCSRPIEHRDWCSMHYVRWRTTGDPGVAAPTRIYGLSLHDRLMNNIRISDAGCWEWQGYNNSQGYGRIRVNGRDISTHRASYEIFVGPIPIELELDHLCRNRSCMNPAHLEPVSHAENVSRGTSGHRSRSKTHCPQGHPYTDGNVHVDTRGARRCRQCGREKDRARRRRGAK